MDCRKCFVPKCKNDSANSPNKIFVRIPEDLLKKWCRELNVEFTQAKKYLENAVISAKGSVERAKVNIEKLCTLKTLYPIYFQGYNMKNIYVNWNEYLIQAFLPKLTNNNCRISLSKCLKDGIKSDMIFNLYRYEVMILEYIKLHDCNDGIIIINDLRDISLMDLITELNVTDFKQMLTIAMEGYAVRVKGIHFITSSSAVEILMKLFKSLVSAKIGSRIYAHKNPDALYEFVPKDILPVEYGGKEKPLQELHDRWMSEITKQENIDFFKEISEACADERLRPRRAHDEYNMGIVGSFRTLNVD